jgi:hypothetical protein
MSSDPQANMLLMLAESFTKLTSALSEKGDSKSSDWPKFSGDQKKFRAWYLSILSQISIPPWKELYDTSRNDIVVNTSNVSLNEKLYAKLIISLESQVLQNIITRPHLRTNGVLLLQDLVQTYHPKHVPEVLAAKAGEFWSQTKRQSNESVDSYYNRFQELLEELSHADDQISTKSAMRHFIFTLGSEFEPIQNNYRIGYLPLEWQTTHWPSLLVLCRDFFHSINPKGLSSTSNNGNNTLSNADRNAQHKKVKMWFSSPLKYCKEIEAEQKQYPGLCIYHLSKSHATEDCSVRKECMKAQATKKDNTNSATKVTGQLRNIKEELFEDAVSEDLIEDDIPADCSNDTKEDDLQYFARLTNHYLHLVRSNHTSGICSRHNMKYPVIADSGANFHMFKEKDFFVKIIPATGSVLLGDGQTALPILGVGTVQCKIDNHIVEIENVRYVPSLAESIYSLFVHIQLPGHGLHSSCEQGLFIKFPTFRTAALIGNHDIYIDAIPVSDQVSVTPILPPDDCQNVVQQEHSLCRNITQFQKDISHETEILDDLLCCLRRYYAEIKTKRQLGLNVPAGFRSLSKLQQDFRSITPPRRAKSLGDLSTLDDISILENFDSKQSNTAPSVPSDSSIISTDVDSRHIVSPTYIPIIRSVDKVPSSLPKKVSMSEDFIRASVGCRHIEILKKNISHLYQGTITLDKTPQDAVLDSGDFATMRKKDRNTNPIQTPTHFGEVVHIDIVFGPDISIGNIHYGLLFADRYSRMTYIYPLQNLTSDIKRQMGFFFSHIGMVPKRIVSDFDTKLIGGQARDYLNSLLVHVNAAPANRQDKNGLAERHWQTMVSMARNWLTSAELPSSYWFYAVKRAAEVCNYFPYKLEDGSYTTPFELAHNAKPDLRNLFKLFAFAAVRRQRVNSENLGKFDSQSLPMIAVGKCPNANGLLFYNPVNQTFVSSIDFQFQHNVTSGTRFNLRYQSGTFIYRLDESTTIYAPKFKLDSKVLVHTHSPPHVATVIGLPTYHRPDIYTVSYPDGSITEYSDKDNILEAIPDSVELSSCPILPSWIKGGATATLFLPEMSKPRHGTLLCDSGHTWFFCPGATKDSSKFIALPALVENCQTLLENANLFRGYAKFKRVYQARSQVQLKTCVLRHVSAHGLTSLLAPSSLKQLSKLNSHDQSIWQAAYDEEYDGLSSLPTWEVLTEDQFKQMSKGLKPLPTTAIATIKYDEHNRPKRAKYRLVVLGNHDPHCWSKEATAAPVLSQLELRILTSLAVYNRRVLKNCDIKQAFVQSSLPSTEQYFLRPPVGCPRSDPGTYWRLIRLLYGLRRAPRLWFEKLSFHLQGMGLQNSINSTCLFVGHLIEGAPPIYVGIYVDDIIYFSVSNEVERKFEGLLLTIGDVDFMGQVSHFLGIEFT